MIRRFTFLLIGISLATSTFGQTTSHDGRRLMSFDGLYAVTIPQSVNLGGGGPLEKPFTEGLGYGYSSYWVTPNVYLQAGHVDFTKDMTELPLAERTRLFLEAVARLKRLQAAVPGFQFLSERRVTLKKLIVTELTFRDETRKVIYRLFPTGKGIVRIMAIFERPFDEATARGFLDSIESPTRQEIVAEKLKEATPTPPPPCSAGTPFVADRVARRLLGNVRSMALEREVTVYGRVTRILREHVEFDPAGMAIKEVHYEADGRPDSVVLYGCVEARRVSKSGYASYENRFTGLAPPRPGARPRDPRYSSAYEVKLDASGRLDERLRYGNDSLLYSRLKYNYGDRTIEVVETDEDGGVSSRRMETLDEKGRTLTIVDRRFGTKQLEWRNSYRIEAFDQNGNWIKRAGKYELFEDEKLQNSSDYVEFRTIVYYH